MLLRISRTIVSETRGSKWSDSVLSALPASSGPGVRPGKAESHEGFWKAAWGACCGLGCDADGDFSLWHDAELPACEFALPLFVSAPQPGPLVESQRTAGALERCYGDSLQGTGCVNLMMPDIATSASRAEAASDQAARLHGTAFATGSRELPDLQRPRLRKERQSCG
eukprot:3023282-Rhodomonas_salina.1